MNKTQLLQCCCYVTSLSFEYILFSFELCRCSHDALACSEGPCVTGSVNVLAALQWERHAALTNITLCFCCRPVDLQPTTACCRAAKLLGRYRLSRPSGQREQKPPQDQSLKSEVWSAHIRTSFAASDHGEQLVWRWITASEGRGRAARAAQDQSKAGRWKDEEQNVQVDRV